MRKSKKENRKIHSELELGSLERSPFIEQEIEKLHSKEKKTQQTQNPVQYPHEIDDCFKKVPVNTMKETDGMPENEDGYQSPFELECLSPDRGRVVKKTPDGSASSNDIVGKDGRIEEGSSHALGVLKNIPNIESMIQDLHPAEEQFVLVASNEHQLQNFTPGNPNFA